MGFCGSDIPSAGESASDIFSALYNYYPGLAQVYRNEQLPTAQAELATAQAVSGPYQELITNLYKTYGPELAKVGSGIDSTNRLASAKTDVDILRGPGKELAAEYKNIDQGLNPEYYATRALESTKLGELMNSINLDDANPEAERLINQENARSGNLANSSATGTVANALSFGNELDKRRNSLKSAVDSATAFLTPASSASTFNPATTALARPTSNTGQSNFAGANTTAGAGASSAAQGFTNQLSTLQGGYATNMANKRDVVDRINEGISSV